VTTVVNERFIEIGGRRIGPGYPTYIVAEMSGNHNQDFESAVAMVHAAKEAGVDAVKLQTYTADTLTIDSDKPPFVLPQTNAWGGRTLYDLYGESYTPWDWQPKLKKIADTLELDLFSTPFDATAVDFLDDMGVDVFKIASFEIMDIPLLKAVAAKGKPIIMSTGMATMAQIDDAVRTVRAEGVEDFVLMQCASAYPAPPESLNLATIPHLADAFGVPSGFSDHSLGIAAPIASVAMGACVIEKHFTLSRDKEGTDSFFSIEPDELKALVDGVRIVEAALGTVTYGPTEAETKNTVFQRSLFFVSDVRAGESLTLENVRVIRPGNGLAPKFYDDIIGKKAARDVERGTPVSWSLVSV
jgi:pseudaminic acid synthase